MSMSKNVLLLRDLTDPERFARDVIDGWINLSYYGDNPYGLICACYSPRAQFSGHWVIDTTLLARGLYLKPKDVQILLAYKDNTNVHKLAEALASSIIMTPWNA